MSALDFAFVIVVSVFVLIGAVCDYRTKKLPNWLTVPGCAAGLVFRLAKGLLTDSGLMTELLDGFGGFATGFGILLVLWLIGSGGAGDVKLMGALGMWLGTKLTLAVFVVSAIFVLVGSVSVLAYHMLQRGIERTRKKYLQTADTRGLSAEAKHAAEMKRRVQRRLMPYGVPVAFATWSVLAWWISHITG